MKKGRTRAAKTKRSESHEPGRPLQEGLTAEALARIQDQLGAEVYEALDASLPRIDLQAEKSVLLVSPGSGENVGLLTRHRRSIVAALENEVGEVDLRLTPTRALRGVGIGENPRPPRG